MQKDNNIERLVKSLHCSCCGKDFNNDSVTFKGQHGELTIIKITCNHCGKNFAVAFMGLFPDEFNTMVENKSESIDVKNANEPINFDDVLNAHLFIQDFDDNWKRYIDNRKDSYTT